MHILYHPTGAVTARAIAAGLGARLTTTPPERAVDVLVRWGSAKRYPHRATVLNGNGAILRMGDKLTAFTAFRDAGCWVPQVYLNLPNDAACYPLLQRERRHSRARDVRLVMQPTDAQPVDGSFFVGYIPTDKEYRIHVFDGQVIRCQRKHLDDPTVAVPWIRNHTHGYIFKGVRPESCTAECDAAVAAVRAMEADFGAVDILRGVDGRPYVLEVNSAPACSFQTARAYCQAIVNKVGGNFDEAALRAHFADTDD